MPTLERPPRAWMEETIREAAADPTIDRASLRTLIRRRLSKSAFRFPTSTECWETYRKLCTSGNIQPSDALEHTLRVKDTRTDSGVAPITVLTKPYPCPGKCVYCPTEARMPKSYISSEPAAARALRLKFDPYVQVYERVSTLERNGHEANKIELIIKGGTWSSYPLDYRRWFIKRCFDAANHLGEKTKQRFYSLKTSLKTNEHAKYRIIGLTIETRPDWVNAKEIICLRELGCTRVELGVQTLSDEVLDITKRGHHIDATIRATALLKQAGFKVDFHMLPGQPGSTPERDIADMQTLFTDPRYCPDMIKLYPCVVLPSTELFHWAQKGDFTPIEGEALKELLIQLQSAVPRYCRISRLIRDFPDHEISHGNKVTNLRHLLEEEMRRRGIPCQCLRCREVGHVKDIDPSTIVPQLFEQWYDNTGGREVFLTMEDVDRKAVFAFLRLRLPPDPTKLLEDPNYRDDKKFVRESALVDAAFPSLRQTAIVRELHTYGTALDLRQAPNHAAQPGVAQHRGYGKKLMQHAEEIAKREGYAHMAVISGIGVRAYYEELGYEECETYMRKNLK